MLTVGYGTGDYGMAPAGSGPWNEASRVGPVARKARSYKPTL